MNSRVSRSVLLSAITATVLLYLGLTLFSAPGMWVHEFFFHRSPIQWATVFLFLLAVGIVVQRGISLAGENRAMKAVEQGKSPGGAGSKAEGSLVGWRIAQIRKLLAGSRGFDPVSLAKEMLNSDEDSMAIGQMHLTAIASLLPLLGFTGTVLGLTTKLFGLFQLGNNAIANPEGIKGWLTQFANGLTTAFDTTLLALGCCILVVALKSILGQGEAQLISRLRRYVLEDLLAGSRSPAPDIPDVLARRLGELTLGFREELRAASAAMIQEARGTLAQAFTDIGRGFQEELARTIARSQEMVRTSQTDLVRATVEELGKRLSPAIDHALTHIREQNGKVAQLLASSFQEGLGAMDRKLDRSLNRSFYLIARPVEEMMEENHGKKS